MRISSVKKSINVLLLLSVVGILSCGEKPSGPTATSIEDFPAPPINIKASVGDRVVGLSWRHPNSGNVTKYKIYRQDSTAQTFRSIGSSDELSYIDVNLQNNRTYRYKISAVGLNGLEGRTSEAVSAVPAIYGVIINSGQKYTNSLAVNLSLTAPSTTTLVKVSNDSLFTNAEWEAFSSPKSWILSPGDGEKTVFVKFRNVQDIETLEANSDRIILDTEAVIRQITHDANKRILTPADTIHFIMDTGESGGRASVDINNVRIGLELFDNGEDGDSVPNDGIYEVDYVIPTGPEVESTLVVGHFRDKAGNVAANLDAPARVTIRKPPKAVELIEVAAVIGSSTSLNLFWSKNSDIDFSNYRIFRSLTPGVTNQSPLVTITQNQNVVTYTDSTLASNTTYYYRVFVYDVTGLFTRSNEKSGTTNPNN